MLHHPTKYHTNALTHFLNLHSTQSSVGVVGGASPANLINNNNLSSPDDANVAAAGQHPPSGEGIDFGVPGTPSSIDGKSFTIAAILGLNNNNNSSKRNFNEVVNLSLNHNKLFGGGGGNGGSFDRFYDASSTANVKHFSMSPSQSGGFHPHHHAAMVPLPNHGHLHHAASESALQSLQQLHHQHGFANREKFKNGGFASNSSGSGKKSQLKSKRVRTIFTPEQLERLEAEFERQQYMVGPERLYLAHTLSLTEAQVKVWFQNRRIKWRKHHLEMIRQRQVASGQTINGSMEHISSENHCATPGSPELAICSDSMEGRSASEED